MCADWIKRNTKQRRGILAAVAAFPVIAGAATWGIADGWLDPGAAWLFGRGDAVVARGDVPRIGPDRIDLSGQLDPGILAEAREPLVPPPASVTGPTPGSTGSGTPSTGGAAAAPGLDADASAGTATTGTADAAGTGGGEVGPAPAPAPAPAILVKA